MEEIIEIGSISNYYGGLNIKESEGKFFWSIENYDECDWQEIPEYLYQTLIKYENERKSN